MEDVERLVFSVEETAKVLGLSKNSTYAAIKSGDIPSIKVGSRILVPKKALEIVLTGGKVFDAD